VKEGATGSRISRYLGEGRWEEARTQAYKAKDSGWDKVLRRVLVGEEGESTAFHLRYFEIAPGGFSTHEKHRHEHVVIAIRGRGRLSLGGRTVDMKHLDVAYVAPSEPHQLSNPFDSPFGFFCLVDAERDRPVALNVPDGCTGPEPEGP